MTIKIKVGPYFFIASYNSYKYSKLYDFSLKIVL